MAQGSVVSGGVFLQDETSSSLIFFSPKYFKDHRDLTFQKTGVFQMDIWKPDTTKSTSSWQALVPCIISIQFFNSYGRTYAVLKKSFVVHAKHPTGRQAVWHRK